MPSRGVRCAGSSPRGFRYLGPRYVGRNALDATAGLPSWRRTLDAGEVTAECLRVTLTGVRDRGYAHRIQRLMILGNHAPCNAATGPVTSPSGSRPSRRLSVGDAGQRVSQYADGGIVATQPYAAGGAYINRMSDHYRNCRYDPPYGWASGPVPSPPANWAWLDRNAGRLTGDPAWPAR